MRDSSSIDKDTLELFTRLNKIIDPLFLKMHPLIASLDQILRDVISNKRNSITYQSIKEKDTFQRRYWNCLWKAKAIFYHFNKIIELEEEYRSRLAEYYKRLHPIRPGGYIAVSTEKMELEFEAFLLQSKACLDVFSRSFQPYLKNDSDNINGLKAELKRHIERNSDPICQAILIELNNSKWLEEFEYKEPRRARAEGILIVFRPAHAKRVFLTCGFSLACFN